MCRCGRGGGSFWGFARFTMTSGRACTSRRTSRFTSVSPAARGGDCFSFVMEYHKLGFREALEHLAQRAGITLTGKGRSDEGTKRRSERDTLAEANRRGDGGVSNALQKRGARQGGPAVRRGPRPSRRRWSKRSTSGPLPTCGTGWPARSPPTDGTPPPLSPPASSPPPATRANAATPRTRTPIPGPRLPQPKAATTACVTG